MIGGGVAIVLGSTLPFVSVRADGFDVSRFVEVPSHESLMYSLIFGLLLTGAAAAQAVRRTDGWAALVLLLSVLGGIGYVAFAVYGYVGVTDDSLEAIRITWAPGIGLLLSIAGCIASCVGAIVEAQS